VPHERLGHVIVEADAVSSLVTGLLWWVVARCRCFVADGTAVGPVVLGGIRFPVSDVFTVGGEIRWQKAVGKGLVDQNEFFLGDKIDLGGWNTNFTFHLRF